MAKQLLVRNPTGKSARPISFIWGLFTTEDEPGKLKHAFCMHCGDNVIFHRKSEYVLAHMKKCHAFHEFCRNTGQIEMMNFVINTAKLTNGKRKVVAVDSDNTSETSRKTVEEPYVPGSFLDFATTKLQLGSQIVDFIKEAVGNALLPAADSAEGDYGLKFKNISPHPLTECDYIEYCVIQITKFLTIYGGRQFLNPNNLLLVGSEAVGIDQIITVLLKRNNCRSGGVIFVEEYTDLALLALFRDRGLQVRFVASDSQGILVSKLHEELAVLTGHADAVYSSWPLAVVMTPSFSDLCGRTMSNGRRIELLQLLSAFGTPLIANEANAMLNFTQELKAIYRNSVSVPTVMAEHCELDDAEAIVSMGDFGFHNTFIVGSFSKIIAPGLCVAWVECSNEADKVALRTSGLTLSGGSINQFSAVILAQCLEAELTSFSPEPELYNHICRIRESLAIRYLTFTKTLMKYDYLLLSHLQGGKPSLEIEGCPWNREHIDTTLTVDDKILLFKVKSKHGYSSIALPLSSAPRKPLVSQGLPSSKSLAQSSMHQIDEHHSPDLTRGNALWPVMTMTASYEHPGSFLGSVMMSAQVIGVPDVYVPPPAPLIMVPQRRQVGGMHVMVRLPAWLIDISDRLMAEASTNSGWAESSNHHAKRICRGSTDGSLVWFIEKARVEYNLELKIDEDFFVHGKITSSYDKVVFTSSGQTQLARPTNTNRFAFFCISKLTEAGLEDGAKRFCLLLSDVYHMIHRP